MVVVLLQDFQFQIKIDECSFDKKYEGVEIVDNNFLLTYLKDGKAQFDWFESQEEMQFFIDNNNLEGIFGAIEVTGCRELDINFNVNK